METGIGPLLLVIVLLLMALFAVSVFLFSRNKRTSAEDDEPFDE
jgi:hypothetical protein